MAKKEFNEATLRTPEGVADLMGSSTTQKEWDQNADAVKAANFNSYPYFYYNTVEASGLAARTIAKFKP